MQQIGHRQQRDCIEDPDQNQSHVRSPWYEAGSATMARPRPYCATSINSDSGPA
ncbi:Uncharacterised protein [Bordetella pertussis]|nr:Uncharacterised protein [Bordetella pertussis]